FVMSDSEHSTVTYASISSVDGSLDVGSLGVIVFGYDGFPMMLEDPYPLPATVSPTVDSPGPEHADDEIVAEDQPYDEDASPTTQSPEYVSEFDLDVYLEEDDDEDPEEDLVEESSSVAARLAGGLKAD
nr:hypothetical protein [Tanacetum cinerariifolium]